MSNNPVKPFIIRVSSQKGGVGKTTVSVNLSIALTMRGYNVLLIDADTANPTVGIHLGFEGTRIGYLDVIRRKVSLKDAVLFHTQSGLHVLPGKTITGILKHDSSRMENLLPDLHRQKYDFVVVDTPPGLQDSTVGYDVDFGVIVTQPSIEACANALRLSTIFRKEDVPFCLVVNRVRNKKYELTGSEIENLYEGKIGVTVREDEAVPISIDVSTPAYLNSRRSKFARSMDQLTEIVINSSSKVRKEFQSQRGGKGLSSHLSRLIGRRESYED